ncbi:hypothetical protein BG261_09660 [Floricoccus tropicus]|uniref:Uncharacterized protein n=1 Tax=Floricoccus tropicus TaxID=1859473 RepID=A0A1E8GNR8_9LACT|nr:hypothetical protein BG261_09660 [Floricoccus tropicus]
MTISAINKLTNVAIDRGTKKAHTDHPRNIVIISKEKGTLIIYANKLANKKLKIESLLPLTSPNTNEQIPIHNPTTICTGNVKGKPAKNAEIRCPIKPKTKPVCGFSITEPTNAAHESKAIDPKIFIIEPMTLTASNKAVSVNFFVLVSLIPYPPYSLFIKKTIFYFYRRWFSTTL